MAPRRTSGRTRSTRQYTVDAFEGLDVEDEASTGEQSAIGNDSGTDGDFHDATGADDSRSEDDGSGDEMLTSDDAVGTANDRPSPVERGGNTQPSIESRKSGIRLATKMSRGRSKASRIQSLFGPAREDIEPATAACKRWYNEPVLPSRRENKHGEGGMAYSSAYTDASRQYEASKGWEWYHDRGGEQAFRTRQVFEDLSADEAARYLHQIGKSDQLVVLGPIKAQQSFQMAAGRVINTSQAWERSDNGQRGTEKGTKGAWLFNLGSKIQSLEWVPWQDGPQYISATTMLTAELRTATDSDTATAFEPAEPSPAAIQVWSIQSTDDGQLDQDSAPKLELVLCTDWGAVRSVKWCPMPRRTNETDGETNLGLLAGVWADGRIRVLDVRYPRYPASRYLRIKTAAFESKPPDCIHTSVCWLSSNHIACGCSNGHFAIFDITESLMSPTPSVSRTRPMIYHHAHSSYILSIASAYPLMPHYIATSGMDGFVRLTDARAPRLDTVLSQRSRVGSSALAWHESTLSFLTNDENHTLLALSIRRFHVNMSVGRANSNIQHISTSLVHPFTLIGCADGMAISTNPMRKVMGPKEDMWHQPWFMHEWRRAMDRHGIIDEASAAADTRSESKLPPKDVRKSRPTGELKYAGPMSRIVEGFKAEVYKLWVDQALPNQYKGVVFNTIYEEESAVTQVAWNPNKRVGGWAAAGMGNGLIRIEDLAL